MHRNILKYVMIGFLFVSIAGSLSHFLYEWSHENRWIALFAPVNESTWEHMKLLFFPMLLYAIYFQRKYEACSCVASSMLLSNLIGTFSIPVLFYSYSGIYGAHVTFIDISIFYISTALAFYLAGQWILRQQRRDEQECSGILYLQTEKYQTLLLLLTVFAAICFFIFTFYPPHWGIFQVPPAR